MKFLTNEEARENDLYCMAVVHTEEGIVSMRRLRPIYDTADLVPSFAEGMDKIREYLETKPPGTLSLCAVRWARTGDGFRPYVNDDIQSFEVEFGDLQTVYNDFAHRKVL